MILLPSLAFAESDPADDLFEFPLNPESEASFDRICTSMSADYITGDFEQIKKSVKSGRALVSKGNIIIDKKKGIVIRTSYPVSSVIFTGSDFVIQTNSSGKKKKFDAAGNGAFLSASAMFQAIFTGNAAALKENYDIFYKTNGDSWLVGIKAKGTTAVSFFSSVLLKGSRSIDTLVFYALNGDTITYSISNIDFPEFLNESELVYFEQ
jgi:hypothetical protein